MSDSPAAPFLDGWHVHKNFGLSETTNPYSETLQPHSFREWESGWSARFNACKHGLDLTYDDI